MGPPLPAHEPLKKKSQATLDVVGVERRRELVGRHWACRDDPGLSFMAGDIAPQGGASSSRYMRVPGDGRALHATVTGAPGLNGRAVLPSWAQLERHRKGEAEPALRPSAAGASRFARGSWMRCGVWRWNAWLRSQDGRVGAPRPRRRYDLPVCDW